MLDPVRWYLYFMPATEIPADTFPAYVQCATCIYWVPAVEVNGAGECIDCDLFGEVN